MTTLIERINRLLFQRAARNILETPPLGRGSERFTALSMVQHRDVVPYLVAIKSFVHHARPERVVLIADPSLTRDDESVLRGHVPFLEIMRAASFRRPSIPVGGTWERLTAIAELCSEASVVQLDADTVTMAKPHSVIEAFKGGRSFLLRSEGGVEIQDLAAARTEGLERGKKTAHVQVAAEVLLHELRDTARYRYARGCSGFTGFAQGALDVAQLADVSAQMRAHLGARWDEWGTEQVTSNLMAASAPNAFMLPHPQYCNADQYTAQTCVTHFIGYARFTSREYERQAAAVAGLLRRS